MGVVHKKQPDGYCNVDKYLAVVSLKWMAHIVFLLSESEELRFGQIRKELAFVSSKVLSERLKMLVSHGFVWRRQNETVPLSVSYGLTDKGRELSEVVSLIIDKAERWGGTASA